MTRTLSTKNTENTFSLLALNVSYVIANSTTELQYALDRTAILIYPNLASLVHLVLCEASEDKDHEFT